MPVPPRRGRITPEQYYSRHSPLLGEECLQRLGRSALAVVGLGGLGCAASTSLVRIGVGKLFVIDSDRVEPSNLNRQFLYTPEDIGRSKVEAACEHLRAMNPLVEVVPWQGRVGEQGFSLPPGIEGVVDCLDNFRSRYALEELVRQAGVFMVHGGVMGQFGQLTTIIPGRTPSLRQLFPSMEEVIHRHVLPQAATIVGTLQAWEAVRQLCGLEGALHGKILSVDLLNNEMRTISLG